MSQLGFDWNWAQRREWINEAVLSSGAAGDGRPVSASAMAGVLNAINDHLGDNAEAWPSQETIAQRLKVSTKTVQRACEALQAASLLIVLPRPCKSGTRNHYRIVWSELQLLQPARRAAWNAILRDRSRGSDTGGQASDTGPEPSDTCDEPSDTLAEPSDTVSNEYYKKTKLENHNHCAHEPAREPDHDPEPHTEVETSQTWEVVVSELIDLGMSKIGARQALHAARGRGLALEQAQQLVELYRERSRTPYSAGRKRITVGWLSRWLSGDSAGT